MYRRYQFYDGKSRICWKGYFITGPKPWATLMTFCLTNIPSFLFYSLVLTKLDNSVVFLLMMLLFQLLFNIFMLITCSTNPGIVPKLEVDMSLLHRISHTRTYNIRYPIHINGKSMNQIFCTTWLVVRPPRWCHWYFCNNWVERFDHHCPWISWCIGKRNYTFFVIFLTSLSSYLLLMLVLSMIVTIDVGFKEGLRHSITALILSIYLFWVCSFVVTLNIYHFYIMTIGETTFENLKGIYRHRLNPFNHKNVLKNFVAQFLPYRGKFSLL